ncbi:alpha-mannosidase [Cavenderia fasciculata]|uniref:Alpha-mannosidase n=1 Tax=Cavenderia fasciculata TaxID=261658 RepID=F4PRG5_CACFS|nr:alpha-mannosidase [Cavenderia fasciculata]EGG20517.1 alpha-mannosidase [Cavenderia fasciculata]|eukprot:XP_004358367.1 alpha-mannosidase [Cavenderia fasciculata]
MMIKQTLLLFATIILLFSSTTLIEARKTLYKGSNKPKIEPPESSVLNVHIVAHTHDDVGWLKTVDQYYYGYNLTNFNGGVQYTLDTAITCLLQNPNRRFIYVEIAYFQRWWNEQTVEMQKLVTSLVKSGQLEFINGGYCMNDEATTYYDDIIDQMTVGHQFILDNFGVVPKIGWHIDPFGHSSSQASLFGAMGFDAFIIGRIDYQDIAGRLENKQMEFVWRGSKSQPKYDIFTSVLRAMYCTPNGFDFEQGDTPMQTDPNLFDVNAQQRADEFAAIALEYATHYQTNNVLIPFGCDFAYMNAQMYFKNIDKLMDYINSNPQYGLNLIYSTPSIYIDAVNKANLVWDVKTDDFFPYADDPYSYWTGYFVSRPALKGYVRQNSQLLHVAEQLLVTGQADIPNVQSYIDSIMPLREAMGEAQHHDAVSGTEKQVVADDYAARLAIGNTATLNAMNNVLGSLLTTNSLKPLASPAMSFCPFLNISVCPATSVLTNHGTSVPVILYNQLGQTRFEHVNIPIPVANVTVSDSNGIVRSQVTPNSNSSLGYVLTFLAQIPPLGFSTYIIENSGQEESTMTEYVEPKMIKPSSSNIIFANQFVSVTFDSATGGIMSITNISSGDQIQISQQYMFYLPSLGDSASGQPSGAYIFRPINTYPFNYNNQTVKVTVSQGSTVQVLTRYWSPTMIQIFRLYDGVPYLEIEETVGPIDISDGIGKEVITQWNTSLNTKQTWWTDSNGQEMQERVYNFRDTWDLNVTQPVSDNYVPINAISYIQDTEKNLQLTFVVDRSRGGASLGNGELEMMLHRRTLLDDWRGVGEPMNESTQIVTTTRVIFHPINDQVQSYYRYFAQELQHPIYPTFTQSNMDASVWNNLYSGTYSPLTTDLPYGLKVQSLQWVDDTQDTIVLRLENIFQVDGIDTYDPVVINFDIAGMFSYLNVTSVTEMTLSSVAKLSSVNRLQWQTNSEYQQAKEDLYKLYPTKDLEINDQTNSFNIQVGPMDIRTYLITVTSNSI